MRRKLLLPALLMLGAAPSLAASGSATDRVDLRLVIAVDTGGQEDINQSVQRHGYEAAFRSPDVLAAIKSGPYGKIAITYVEFASAGLDTVVVPWTVVASQQDATAIADELASSPVNQGPSAVSISGVILFAMDAFDQSVVDSNRRSVDISGDGPNASGLPVTQVRDSAIAAGITINGLPVLLNPDQIRGGDGTTTIDDYYRACVIGGPSSFVLPVNGISEFAAAIQRKLILEIAALSTPLVPVAQKVASGPVDCAAIEPVPQSGPFLR